MTMGRDLQIWHTEEDPQAPFDLGLAGEYAHKVEVYDNNTHESATGWGYTYEEALQNAIDQLSDEEEGET